MEYDEAIDNTTLTEADMFIEKILSQHRNDFTATLKCEHCESTQKLTTGYHDAFYHEKVIPAIACHACGKKRDGEKGHSEFANVAS